VARWCGGEGSCGTLQQEEEEGVSCVTSCGTYAWRGEPLGISNVCMLSWVVCVESMARGVEGWQEQQPGAYQVCARGICCWKAHNRWCWSGSGACPGGVGC
jgi:hypothetical protein